MATSDDHALLLQVSADITGLEKAFNRAAGLVKKKSKDMTDDATSLEKFFGKPSLTKALDKVFDNTRFKILDTGAARIGLFGSALESLGPIGLAAAAGVGAVGAAFVGAREAAKFAGDIADIAERVKVSTDGLQQFRFAIREAGGDERGADEALESFRVTLGKAEAGVTKSLRPFRELFGKQFGPENVKQLGGVEAAIDKIAKAIVGLNSEQKGAVLDQFGLAGLAPLIERGLPAMNKLKAEAKSLGLVMDAELVKRGAELDKQFDATARVIETQLKSALVDLGPVLLGLLQQMAKLATLAADVADGFKTIENKRSSHLVDLRQDFNNRAASPLSLLFGGASKDRDRASRALGELIRRAVGPDAAPKKVAPTHTLTDLSKTPKGPRDDSAGKTDEVTQALAQADKALLEAKKALTDDLDARARFETEALAAEATAQKAAIDRKIDGIKADKGIDAGLKKRLTAELEIAKTEIDEATVAKQELVARTRGFAYVDERIDTYKALTEATISELEAQAALASTAQARTAIEARILALRQQLEHDLQTDALDRQLKTGGLDQSEHDRRVSALDRGQAAARTQFNTDHETPVQKYLRSIQDLNTTLESDGVNAAHSLAQGLAEAAMGARTLGDVARNVFLQLSQDILKDILEKNVTGPLASFGSKFITSLFVPHALGTSFAAGGPAIVGEQGPEAVWLPRGARVDPTSRLRQLMSMGAPAYGGAAAAGSGGGWVQHNEINFNGPVSNGREVQLSAQQAQARLARAAAAGRRGV